ncbi:hypothetical protein CYV19_10025 [Natronobacterium gregoryi SP2]|uniref:Uncharacterized protein n=1 Tax=Natronobacterium gregoryi (strain ATCC 43098 / DSM 3393 / CCM 3738 / CIP 104747 / IAM 13177 / JCM 8860 / NBRC 102187 / NCIMB 2189 / SP2) TaxID=797304 RepID=A0A2J4JEH3_NATGS|nr:hypothetical protein CYV19_10025 [Natronobacterium gregoryi SP2]
MPPVAPNSRTGREARTHRRRSKSPPRHSRSDRLGVHSPLVLVPSQPSTDGSNRATPPDSTYQFRLGPPLVLWQA